MNSPEPFSVIGIDLALLNTGIVLVDHRGKIEVHKTIRIKSAKVEKAKILRLSAWVSQATEVFEQAFLHIRRERGSQAPVFIVYESRPFLSGKHKQGRQSIQSVLSFGKSLALMRVAIANAAEKVSEVERFRMGAIPSDWWQLRLLGNGPPITGRLLDEAEDHLARANTPKSQRGRKAAVLAAVYLRSGIWLEDDHQADAAGLAITVADHLSMLGCDSFEEVIDGRYTW